MQQPSSVHLQKNDWQVPFQKIVKARIKTKMKMKEKIYINKS